MTTPSVHRLVFGALAALVACASEATMAAEAPLNADLNTWTCVGQCGATAADGDVTLSPLGNAAHAYVTTAGSLATQVSPIKLTESGGRGTEFTQTNGSSYTSAAFTAQAGDTVNAYFNYVSTDGKGFDDYAWARVINANDSSLVAWLFTARSTNSNKRSIVPGDLAVDFDPGAVIVNYANFDFNTRNLKTPAPVNWSLLGASNGSCWRDAAEGCGFSGWLHSRISLAQGGSYKLEVGVVNFGDEIYDSGLAFDVAQLSAPTVAVPEAGTLPMLLSGLGLLAWGLRRRATVQS
jgi:PEP-CTERM motif